MRLCAMVRDKPAMVSTTALVDILTRIAVNTADRGPISEYEARVESGSIRDDEHQRGTSEMSPETAHPQTKISDQSA